MSVRVVRFPKLARSRNDYMLYATRCVEGVEFVDWSLVRLVCGRYDLVHLNWPETRWTRRGLLMCLLGSLEVGLGLFASAIRRRPAALTLHNWHPHDVPHRRLHRVMSRFVGARIRGVVVLNPDHASEARRRFPGAAVVFAPLGRYEWARPCDSTKALPPLILSHGLQRPYKGTPELIRASTGSRTPHQLAVIGDFDTAVIQESSAIAAGAPHVMLVDRHQTRDELEAAHCKATVVVVPFRQIDNTSSLLLSLCFGVPVAGPALSALERLRALVGSEWVFTWDGEINPRVLDDVLAWAMTPRSRQPDLEAFSWAEHRQAVGALYRSLVD